MQMYADLRDTLILELEDWSSEVLQKLVFATASISVAIDKLVFAAICVSAPVDEIVDTGVIYGFSPRRFSITWTVYAVLLTSVEIKKIVSLFYTCIHRILTL